MPAQFWFFLCFPGLPALVIFIYARKLIKARKEAARPFNEMRRHPAYSLIQRADDQWETFTTWLSMTAMVALLPWLVFTLSEGEAVITPLVFGLITSPVCLWQMWAAYQPLPNWWLGIRGEQYVGAELDAIQDADFKVFHDLVVPDPNGDWNIDHVVATRAGLFVVETKAKRKKHAVDTPRHKLSFDGHKINFPDGSYEVDSVKQASRQARWLEQKTREWCGGISVPVIPVLTYPGWWVDVTGKGEVQVVNPKQIFRVVKGRRAVLDERSWKIILSQLKTATTVELPLEKKPRRRVEAPRNGNRSRRKQNAIEPAGR